MNSTLHKLQDSWYMEECEHLLNKDSRGRSSSGERAAAIWGESNWGQNRAIKCLAGWVVGGGQPHQCLEGGARVFPLRQI